MISSLHCEIFLLVNFTILSVENEAIPPFSCITCIYLNLWCKSNSNTGDSMLFNIMQPDYLNVCVTMEHFLKQIPGGHSIISTYYHNFVQNTLKEAVHKYNKKNLYQRCIHPCHMKYCIHSNSSTCSNSGMLPTFLKNVAPIEAQPHFL